MMVLNFDSIFYNIREMQTIEENNLHFHHDKLYDEDIADEIFALLNTIEMNSDEDSQVFLYGEWINIPRKQTAFGDEGTTYTFSGNTVPARSWPPFLLAVRERIADWLVENIPDVFAVEGAPDAHPNFVLVNLYENGKHYIGPHSDDEKDLAKMGENKETIIVSLSFGETRTFKFENTGRASKRKTASITKEVELAHGDICVMRGNTQQYWKHSVPKKGRCKNPRFNLTFRFMSISRL